MKDETNFIYFAYSFPSFVKMRIENINRKNAIEIFLSIIALYYIINFLIFGI